MESNDISLKEHLEFQISALKELLESKIKGLEDAHTIRNEMNSVAIKKAEDTMNFRLSNLNELHSQMKDQQSTFLPISEFGTYLKSHEAEYNSHIKASQIQFDGLKAEINKLSTIQQVVAGKAGQPMVWIVGAATVVGLILSIISLIQKWVAP